MRLSALISDTELAAQSAHDCEITGVSLDSRTVQSGDLFAALPGAAADGARFISDAVEQGAVAVVTGTDTEVPGAVSVPVLRTPNPRQFLAKLAAKFYAPQPNTVVAVTGTSGKTSVADFTRQIFLNAGRSAASIGTIGVITADEAHYGSLTTPDSVTLHKTLSKLAHAGIDHLAMEASSHGLDQYRLDGVRLRAAAFTNLGRDHLDYHPDVESYLKAKLRLFSELLPVGGTAVVNVDDPVSKRVIEIAKARGQSVIDVGKTAKRVRLDGVSRDGFAQCLSLTINGDIHDVRLCLVGDYQVSNALVAAGLAIAAGITPDAAVAALSKLVGVAGRLEIVGNVKGALMVVDYAHKPDALEAALRAARPFATGRLIVVFGCGGDRDKGKRPLMGKIATDGADIVIVTDDNPRTEDADKIRAEVRAGLQEVTEIGDRRQAIRYAVEVSRAGDVVLVAGKGHETGQIVGQDVIPFSDHEELKSAMETYSE